MPGPSHCPSRPLPPRPSRPAGLTYRTARCTVDRCPGGVGWLPCWSAHHSPVWRLSHHWVGKDHSRWTCGCRDLREIALHGQTEWSPTLTGCLLYAMPKKGACVPFSQERDGIGGTQIVCLLCVRTRPSSRFHCIPGNSSPNASSTGQMGKLREEA